jgi:hypothetical protein
MQNNKLNTTKSKITKKNTTRQRKTRFRRRLPNNRTRRANVIRGNRIAAASAKSLAKKFSILRQNGTSVRVTGRDLIYPIPDNLTAPIQSTNIIAVIPANPAYWTGTRIAALASGYQTYRPIKFRVTYIPICAVTQQGNVIGGTVWDDGFDPTNVQQSLRTSNGGFITQCYVPHSTTIRPKANLPFNLYKIGGAFNDKTNPFIFIAMALGTVNSNNQRVIPGYFYVTWSFELKNPIGKVNQFYNSGLTLYENLQLQMNNTLVNLATNTDIPFGAYIDLEDDKQPYYNQTQITIQNNTPVWMFSSVTKTTTASQSVKEVITYSTLQTSNVVALKAGRSASSGTFVDDYRGTKVIIIDKGEYYMVLVPYETKLSTNPSPALVTMNVTIENAELVYLSEDDSQIFGTLQDDTILQTAITSQTATSSGTYCSTFYAYKNKFEIQIESSNTKSSKPTVNQVMFKTLPMKSNSKQEQPVKEEDAVSENNDQEVDTDEQIQLLQEQIEQLKCKNK